MSTVINTNLASLFAQNSLTNAQNNLATSVQRLSSGLRINSAKDDAAGLAISQNMQSQILGTNQSINNLSDATNLLQTADSSLSTIQDMLLKLKQLSVQGYDGSLNATQKADIVTQMQDLNTEINATAQRTQFNGINLLTSGSSIDSVNSDLKTGSVLAPTMIALDTTSGLGAATLTNLGDIANAGTNGLNTTIAVQLDPAQQKSIPGAYTLTANGANLTMTGVFNGQAQSQTVTIADAVGNNVAGATKVLDQSLDFSNFGIKLNIKSTTGANTTNTGAQLASAVVSASGANHQISIKGNVGEITDVRLSGTAPATYTMSYSAQSGTVSTLSGSTSSYFGGPIASDGLSASGAPTTDTAGAVANTYTVALLGGTGSGATVDITRAAGGGLTYKLHNAGTGYQTSDVLTVNAGWGTDTGGHAVGAALTGFSVTGLQNNGVATANVSGTLPADASLTASTSYTNVAMTDNGSTIYGTVIVDNLKHVTGVQITSPGHGAKVGDTLAIAAGAITTGSLAISSGITVATLASAPTNPANKVVDGNYVLNLVGDTSNGQPGTSGTGATAGVTVTNGAITSFNLLNQGTGYKTGDTLKVAAAWGGSATSTALTGLSVGSLGTVLTQNQLTLTGSVNGVATTQSVNITDNSANNTETINFGSFGVAFDVKSYQNQTANQIGQSLAALNSTSNGTPGQIIVGQGANSNLQFQSGANSSAFIGINTLNVQTGVTGTNAGSNSAMMTVGTDITGVNATGSAQGSLGTMTANNSISDWQTAFQNAAAAIDKAVDYISTQRATYGSQMNRLSYISSNLTAQSTNLQTSKSSITDTNFASETATLTKGQIMQQAATAMLAQANQMPNVILSLLK